MKKYIIIIFLLICDLSLLCSADFLLYKESRFDVYFEKDYDMQVLEYLIQLMNFHDSQYSQKMSYQPSQLLKFYIYKDAYNFTKEGSGNSWQNPVIKTNQIVFSTSPLLSADKHIQNHIKYFIYRENLNEQYGNKLPSWFLNGLSIFYTDKSLFQDNSLRITNIISLNEIMVNYKTKTEYDKVNFLCLKGIKDLLELYNENVLLKFMNSVASKKEFEIKFFNHLGISYSDYIREVLFKKN
jgi:hypothetical protein